MMSEAAHRMMMQAQYEAARGETARAKETAERAEQQARVDGSRLTTADNERIQAAKQGKVYDQREVTGQAATTDQGQVDESDRRYTIPEHSQSSGSKTKAASEGATMSNAPPAYDSTKEYFEVSIYRNILDMINSYDGALKAVGNWIHNKLLPLTRKNDRAHSVELAHEAYSYVNKRIPTKSGNARWNYDYFLDWINDFLKDHGISRLKWKEQKYPQTSAYDLLSLARSLEWEMNRVRLPMPHNFRQLSALLEGRNYDVRVKEETGPPYISMKTYRMQGPLLVVSGPGLPALMELADALPGLKKEVEKIRTAVRKEIDAANYAKKVEEETLRQEREELKEKEQAEKEAKERAAQILAEKEAAYLSDYETLVEKHDALVDEREALRVEYDDLTAAIASADDVDTLESLQDDADAIASEIAAIEEERAQIVTQLDTLQKAINNIETEKAEVLAVLDSQDSDDIRESMQQLQQLKADLAGQQDAIIARLQQLGQDIENSPSNPANDEEEAGELEGQLERDQQAQELADRLLELQADLLDINQQLANATDQGTIDQLMQQKAALAAEVDNLKKQGQDLEQQNIGKGTGVGPIVVLGLLTSLAVA